MSTIQTPTYTPAWNLPAPVTTGTTIQNFTDPNGEVWVAKNGVNSGMWFRARDALHGIIYRNAAYNMPTAAAIIAYDAVLRDVYGMSTGASNYGFAAPIPGWYLAFAMLQGTCTVANAFIQGSIARNGTFWSSDNEFSALASGGGLLWRTSALLYLAAGDIVNVNAYNANGFAVSGSWMVNRLEFDYMGTG